MWLWEMLYGVLNFSAVYCTTKCIRTMIAGMILFPVILFVRSCNRSKDANINFYMMLLMFPAACTGMSKLFFLPKTTAVLSNYLNWLVVPLYGKIYLGVMFLLLARFLYRNLRLQKCVRRLERWEEPGELQTAVSCVTREDFTRLPLIYLRRVSPFSGGLVHPFVVLPQDVAKDWTKEKRRLLLCHELLHLKSGHIFYMTLFELLKIYWWGNPLIYLCDRILREDMEMVCDSKCLRCAEVSGSAYARTFLDMIAYMQGIRWNGTLAFFDRNDFGSIRKRIRNLYAAGKQGDGRRQRRNGMIFAAVFAFLCSAVWLTSYPKYTKLDDLCLYDEELHLLEYDSEKLREAVSVSEGRLVIEEEKFRELLEQKDVKGEYVYVGFDTIMKVPGSGGAGNTGMICMADYSDIFYLRAQSVENDILEFWLKYLI